MSETVVKPRLCTQVIRKMLEVLPEDQGAFRLDLEWNLEDAAYKAPEQKIQWARTHSTLVKHIPGPPTEKWQFELLSIFTTKSVEELKANFKKINDGE